MCKASIYWKNLIWQAEASLSTINANLREKKIIFFRRAAEKTALPEPRLPPSGPRGKKKRAAHPRRVTRPAMSGYGSS